MSGRDPCLSWVRGRCRTLVATYQQQLEEHITLLQSSCGDQLMQCGGAIAAYSLAECAFTRLQTLTSSFAGGTEGEQVLPALFAGCERELLFLSSPRAALLEQRSLDADEVSSAVRCWQERQAQVLHPVLLALEEILAALLTRSVSDFMGQERIRQLDAEPFWIETTRRAAVAAALDELSAQGRLDAVYARIARVLLAIEYPSDICDEEDRYRRFALPTLVRRLTVRDLLAFIASISVLSAQGGPPANGDGWCLVAAQTLLARRAATVPQPTHTLRVQLDSSSLSRIREVGLLVEHGEPCLLCQTSGDHCGVYEISFPVGTDFTQVPQSRVEQMTYSLTFAPTLPGGLPANWCLFLSYSGIWEPECPWSLTLLDLSQDPAAA